MIGIDTNVLLRFLAADDLVQFEKARRLIFDDASLNQIRINSLVLMETVWVLRSVYKQSDAKIIQGMAILLAIPSIEIEGRDTLSRVTQFNLPLSLLADGLIAEANGFSGCLTTYTFDQDAASKIPGMELLS